MQSPPRHFLHALTDSRVSMFSCRKEAMSFQSRMSPSQLFCLCAGILWPARRPAWVTFCNKCDIFNQCDIFRGSAWTPSHCRHTTFTNQEWYSLSQSSRTCFSITAVWFTLSPNILWSCTQHKKIFNTWLQRRNPQQYKTFIGLTLWVIHSLPCW